MVRKLVLLAALLLGLSASPAMAATITVSTTQDVLNNNVCSLRAAVTAANTRAAWGACRAGDPSGNRIVLGAGHYVLTAGELVVSSSVTIVGQPGATVIDALGLSRVLEVGSTGNLKLSGLTLTHGRAPDGSYGTSSAPGGLGGSGGAVENKGVLTLDHVAVVGNRAGNGGSGISGSCLYPIVPSAGNGGNGGGIESAGSSLTIVDSTIAGNRAGDGGRDGSIAGGAGGNGGGIDVIGGAVSITGSTISANLAGNAGAGSCADGVEGGAGGGVALIWALGTLANDTIAGNAAGQGGGHYFLSSDGGAIYQAAGRLTLSHVTVADNTEQDFKNSTGNISTTGGMSVANSALEATCHGPVTDGGHNVTLPAPDRAIYSQPACPGRQLEVTGFNLGPLQDNGGPTQTMVPEPGSALIGAVPSKRAGCMATDQRGVARPQGPACDAGAVEVRVPVVAAQPRPVRFPPTVVGHVRRTTVRLRVTAGEMPLRIGRAQITGRNARDFAVVKNRYRGKALNPGQSCTLVISFRPRGPGLRTAKVTLDVRTPGAPVKIALVGTGVR